MQTRRIAVGLVAMMAGGLAAAAGALAEEPAAAPPRGNIVGVVQDAGGTPVEGVAIEVLDEGGTVVKSATSSRAGGYEIPCVAAGEYALRLEPGSSPHRGQKVVAPVTGEGVRVDWTVAPDKPALARAQPGGGTCGSAAAGAEGAGTTAAGASDQAVSAGLLGGYVATTGTIAGLSASGAFDSGKSDSPNQ